MKFLQARIPTLLGLITIIAGLSLTTLLANNKTLTQTRAEVDNQPLEVRITNITDDSFSVSYKTNSETSGVINYGIENQLNDTAFDERDLPNDIGQRNIHIITIHNLNPSTKYNFSIISGGESYLNNDHNFEITTAAQKFSQINETISGKVINEDSTAPKEAIVYVMSDNSQVLSSILDKDGNYSISLNDMLTANLSAPFEFSLNTPLKLLVVGNSSVSNAVIYYSQASSVPVITLSNDYDFRSEENIDSSTSSATFEDFPSLSSSGSSKISPKIISPENDASFSTDTPEFTGTGVPNQSVEITIHSDEAIQTTVTTDSKGNWKYVPSTSLSSGTHTITIASRDSTGILRTITQSFEVLAAETSVTPTPTPDQVANDQTSLNLTITPTPITGNLTSSTSATPTVQNPLPPTGNEFIITAGIIGIILTFLGGLLFFLS